MENSFDKEEFLKQIHTIPFWVKDGDSLLKFCKHIQYRLFQTRAENAWYRKNFKIDDDHTVEFYKIINDYDDAYNNDKSEFQLFEEILKRQNNRIGD